MANESITKQIEKLDPKLKEALVASVKDEIVKDVRAQIHDEVKADLTKQFEKEERLKTKNDNVKRTVKLKVLKPIIINGVQYKEGDTALASEEEAKMFTKPIQSKFEGWGEGLFKKVLIHRAQLV